MVDYREVLDYLAPCGLDCSRCADYEEGEIRELAAQLLEYLGNYSHLARLKADRHPEFAAYVQFEAILNYFANASCGGCRAKNSGHAPNCRVATCIKEKGVDYCFQCAQFPCDGGNPEALTPAGRQWKDMNESMRLNGVIAYYYEQSRLPRY